MKAKFVVGMLMITTMAAPAFAGVTPATIRTEMTKYIERDIKPHVFGQGRTSADGLAANAQKIANEKILNRMDLSAAERTGVQSALSGDAKKVEQRLENLAALMGAREMAKSLIQKREAVDEAQSILEASKALTKTIANSVYSRTKDKSDLLSKEELADAALAVDKMENLGEAVVKMDKSERDMYAAVENKRAELLDSGRFSGEEALVEAVMAVKGVSKDKALEIVRKLKDCV